MSRHITVNGVKLSTEFLAGVATYFDLPDRLSAVRVAYWLRTGHQCPFHRNSEVPRVGQFTVCEYSAGFALCDELTGEEKWLSDGVDALRVCIDEHDIGEVTLSPGCPFFVEAWEDSFNDDADTTREAYFSPTEE